MMCFQHRLVVSISSNNLELRTSGTIRLTLQMSRVSVKAHACSEHASVPHLLQPGACTALRIRPSVATIGGGYLNPLHGSGFSFSQIVQVSRRRTGTRPHACTDLHAGSIAAWLDSFLWFWFASRADVLPQ